jgi:uncharacterized protein (UPF0254 family)
MLPVFVSGQIDLTQKPRGGVILENSFSQPAFVGSLPIYHNLRFGFYKNFSLTGKAFQPWIPFLRTEVVLGGRQGDFFNSSTAQTERVNCAVVDVNVILPVRWSLGENVFCNVGIGLQTGIGRNSVFTDTNPTSQLLRTSINPSIGIITDVNVSFGGRTNACMGTRMLLTYSSYSYMVNSFYFGFSLPNLFAKKE